MRNKTKQRHMFDEGAIWKEKNSNAHIWLGVKNNELIECFLTRIEDGKYQTRYSKQDFWTNAHPSAIFDNFIRIL
jgi:hypothetical protein